jgi:hypothetical protein
MSNLTDLGIEEYSIKCFLENRWNAYILPKNLTINTDSLFNDAVTHFTKESRMKLYDKLHPQYKKEIENQIKQVCQRWFDDFNARTGNYKVLNYKQL